MVIDHFQKMGDAASEKNPQLFLIMAQEWQRGTDAKSAEIASLETKLSNTEDPATDEAVQDATRLLFLSNGNLIALKSLQLAKQVHADAQSQSKNNNSNSAVDKPAAKVDKSADGDIDMDDEIPAAAPAAESNPQSSAGDGAWNNAPVTGGW
jgi:hypothetical protein